MVTLEEIRKQIGISADVISDEQLQAEMDLAVNYCNAFLQRYGASQSGASYEAAISYLTQANVRLNLDLRGIKPSSLSIGGLSMSTDVITSVEKLKELAHTSLKSAVTETKRPDSYIYHVRSGRTVR